MSVFGLKLQQNRVMLQRGALSLERKRALCIDCGRLKDCEVDIGRLYSEYKIHTSVLFYKDIELPLENTLADNCDKKYFMF